MQKSLLILFSILIGSIYSNTNSMITKKKPKQQIAKFMIKIKTTHKGKEFSSYIVCPAPEKQENLPENKKQSKTKVNSSKKAKKILENMKPDNQRETHLSMLLLAQEILNETIAAHLTQKD